MPCGTNLEVRGFFPKATTAKPKRLSSISQQLCQSYFSQSHSAQQLFSKSRPNQTHPKAFAQSQKGALGRETPQELILVTVLTTVIMK
jgi:hypothetical protein